MAPSPFTRRLTRVDVVLARKTQSVVQLVGGKSDLEGIPRLLRCFQPFPRRTDALAHRLGERTHATLLSGLNCETR